MPKNAPPFCTSDVMPFQNVSLPRDLLVPAGPAPGSACGRPGPTRSKLKKPMPQRPTTPAKASTMPTIVFRRQRGSPKSSASEPSCGLPSPSSSSSRAAAFQRSGSLSRRKIGIDEQGGDQSRPGTSPARRWRSRPISSSLPSTMLITAASMLPTAESAWSQPSAIGRRGPT